MHNVRVENQVVEIPQDIIDRCIEEANEILPGWKCIFMTNIGSFVAASEEPKFLYDGEGRMRFHFDNEDANFVYLSTVIDTQEELFRVHKG